MKKLFQSLVVVSIALIGLPAEQANAQIVETALQDASTSPPNASDQSDQDVAVDGSGRRFVCGQMSGTAINFNTGGTNNTNISVVGNQDAYVTAYDPSDQLLWAVDIGGAGMDAAYGICVAPDAVNATNIYVTGFFTGTNVTVRNFTPTGTATLLATLNAPSLSATDITYFLIKLDAAGGFIWSSISAGLTATDSEEGRDVSATRIGSSVLINVTGRYTNQATFNSNNPNTFTTPAGIANNWDAFVLHYTDGAAPSINWGNTIRSAVSNDIGCGVTCDDKGAPIVTGQITNNAQFSSLAIANAQTITTTGSDDIFVSRYDSGGNIRYAMRMGGSGISGNPITTPMDYGKSIAIDRNGDIYVTGLYSASTSTNADFGGAVMTGTIAGTPTTIDYNEIFVVSLNDASATTTVPPVANWAVRMTSNRRDYATKICTDNCGVRLYLCGIFRGTTLTFPGGATMNKGTSTSQDGFFAELNTTNGNEITTTHVGPAIASNTGWILVAAIDINSVGDVSFCGHFNTASVQIGTFNIANSSTGTYDSFLGRWDNINYPISVPSTMTNFGLGQDGCNIYTSGVLQGSATVASTTLSSNGANGDAYMFRSDLYGNPNLFVKLTNDIATTTVTDQTNDPSGNQLVSGNTNNRSQTGFAGYSIAASGLTTPSGYVCKTNNSGIVQWAVMVNAIGGTGQAYCYGIASNYNNDVFVCGCFNGTLQFETTAGIVAGPATLGGKDYFVAKFNPNGTLQWCMTGGSSGDDQANNLEVQISDIYITGAFSGTATFYGAYGTSQTLTSAGGLDGFILRMYDQYLPVGATLTSRQRFAYGAGSSNDLGTSVAVIDPLNVGVTGVSSTNGMIRSFDMTNPLATTNWGPDFPGVFTYRIATVNHNFYVATYFTSPNYIFAFRQNSTWFCSALPPNPAAAILILSGNTYGDDGENVFTAGNQQVSRLAAEGCGLASRIGQHEPTQDQSANGQLINSSPVSVYPNPASTEFTVAISNTEPVAAKFEVYDLSGRLVLSVEKLDRKETRVDCSSLKPGLYFYSVTQGNSVNTGKIIIHE